MDYQYAKTRALKINKKFNAALDYGTAYVFYIKDDKADNNSPIAVDKKSGKVMLFSQYLLTRNTNASPTSIPF